MIVTPPVRSLPSFVCLCYGTVVSIGTEIGLLSLRLSVSQGY